MSKSSSIPIKKNKKSNNSTGVTGQSPDVGESFVVMTASLTPPGSGPSLPSLNNTAPDFGTKTGALGLGSESPFVSLPSNHSRNVTSQPRVRSSSKSKNKATAPPASVAAAAAAAAAAAGPNVDELPLPLPLQLAPGECILQRVANVIYLVNESPTSFQPSAEPLEQQPLSATTAAGTETQLSSSSSISSSSPVADAAAADSYPTPGAAPFSHSDSTNNNNSTDSKNNNNNIGNGRAKNGTNNNTNGGSYIELVKGELIVTNARLLFSPQWPPPSPPSQSPTTVVSLEYGTVERVEATGCTDSVEEQRQQQAVVAAATETGGSVPVRLSELDIRDRQWPLLVVDRRVDAGGLDSVFRFAFVPGLASRRRASVREVLHSLCFPKSLAGVFAFVHRPSWTPVDSDDDNDNTTSSSITNNKGAPGWSVYDPMTEFARLGIVGAGSGTDPLSCAACTQKRRRQQQRPSHQQQQPSSQSLPETLVSDSDDEGGGDIDGDVGEVDADNAATTNTPDDDDFQDVDDTVPENFSQSLASTANGTLSRLWNRTMDFIGATATTAAAYGTADAGAGQDPRALLASSSSSSASSGYNSADDTDGTSARQQHQSRRRRRQARPRPAADALDADGERILRRAEQLVSPCGQCSGWRLSRANADFSLAPTCDNVLVVPSMISDQDLVRVAEFRDKKRLPLLSWRCPRTGASLSKGSQPKTGISSHRSAADEYLLQAMRLSSVFGTRGVLHIVDARPMVNALAQMAMGAGYENLSYYPGCELEFLGIANIHAVRSNRKRMRAVCQRELEARRGQGVKDWLSTVDGTNWPATVRSVLVGGARVADLLAAGRSVFLHCSDGWDRTPQVASVAQLLLDPYYRTALGFCVLIEKEWICAGHKFSDRLGHCNANVGAPDRAPIWLQFLECVWNVMDQHPTAFEFTESLLFAVAEGAHSLQFGTFLGNCARDRARLESRTRTPSLWTYLFSAECFRDHGDWRNPLYSRTSDEAGARLILDTSSRRVRVWESFHLRSRKRAAAVPQSRTTTGHVTLPREPGDCPPISLAFTRQLVQELKQARQEISKLKQLTNDISSFK